MARQLEQGSEDETAFSGRYRSISGRLRKRAIGAILVEEGRLSNNDVDTIQRYAAAHGLRFGDAAVQLNLLTPADIEYALASQFKFPILARGGPGGVADDVAAAHSPDSDGIEALRALRSQLSLRWLRTTKRKILTIVSTEQGEGRSWLIANLAVLFAQAGERTLIFDADMRRPRQHALFNIDNSSGLSGLLTGRAGKDIAPRIHPQMRLFVLPAGQSPPNPQELLTRPVFDVVMDRCATQFDVILVDTPPMNDVADAQILSAHAGSALMLVRRNHTLQAGLTVALDNLQQAGVNVVGSVVSDR